MLDLLELEQLAAFADCGDSVKSSGKSAHFTADDHEDDAALEEGFRRSAVFAQQEPHCIDETGWKAVEYARELLKDAKEAVEGVRAFDRSLHTITVSSCAPAPLWYLLPDLNESFPDMTISSSIKNTRPFLRSAVRICTLAVLPEEQVPEDHCSVPFLKENLSICVPPDP